MGHLPCHTQQQGSDVQSCCRQLFRLGQKTKYCVDNAVIENAEGKLGHSAGAAQAAAVVEQPLVGVLHVQAELSASADQLLVHNKLRLQTVVLVPNNWIDSWRDRRPQTCRVLLGSQDGLCLPDGIQHVIGAHSSLQGGRGMDWL